MYDEKEQLLEVAQTRSMSNERAVTCRINEDYPEDIDRRKRYSTNIISV